MKIKTGICIIMALLMTISAFSISTATGDDCNYKGEIEFTKKVWDSETNEWKNQIESEINEVLRFKLELKYFMDDYYNETPLSLYNITIIDDYSWNAYCFEYIDGSATIIPTEIYEGIGLKWELDEELEDEENLVIEFEMKIVDVDCEQKKNKNSASVTATECGIYEHYAEDNAIVFLKQGIIVEKKVWFNNEWVEEIPYVKKCENIKFQIKATYYGMINMKCGIIADLLPDECLEYLTTTKVNIAGQTYTPDDEQYPEIKATLNDTIIICDETIELSDLVNYFGDYVIIWDWRNSNLFLENGESIILEFEVDVTNYCCQETYKNWAITFLAGCFQCDQCNYVYAYDSANVSCCPPPTTFEKQVSKDNGQTWEEEVDVTADSTVKFNLKFTYYGNEEYNDVRIKDVLPCIIEYIDGSANIQPTSVSEDKKTIWWNLTDTLKDCDVITITFDALVTGTTGCDCKAINNAWIYLYEEQECEDVIVAEYHDTASITSGCNCYPHADLIEAPADGVTGEVLIYKVKGYDQHGDNIKFGFDWDGDKIVDEWTGYHPENTIVSHSHSWETQGVYDVRVKAKDIHGAEGPWSEPAESVNITPAAPVIEIGFKGGFNKIKMIITNNKDGSLNESYYNLTVTAGLLFSKTIQYNETVNLSTGANNIILPWKSILGKIGSVNINGTILLPGYTDPIKIEGSGFVLGRFFIFM